MLLYTLVIPGKSTKVRFTTRVEKILRLIGSGQIPLLCPAILSVSLSISDLISLKSVKILPLTCKNLPHSSMSNVPVIKQN